MVDLTGQTTTKVEWEKYGILVSGTRIQILLSGVSVFDKTVPAGKSLRGRISLDGELF